VKKYQLCTLALAIVAAAALCLAQTSKKKTMPAQTADTSATHVLLTPAQMQWGPAPPSLPPGAQLAVLAGDPSKAGVPFTIRVKLPDGYKIPPHWHPEDENVVVIEGALMMSLGDKFDESSGHEMTAGSFALMPKGVRHFAWAKGETLIQVYGIGPFAINYVNQSDDPGKKALK
jgi:quercetin dioxygenase-like cupin family protein